MSMAMTCSRRFIQLRLGRAELIFTLSVGLRVKRLRSQLYFVINLDQR
jgi:hypothetical protein